MTNFSVILIEYFSKLIKARKQTRRFESSLKLARSLRPDYLPVRDGELRQKKKKNFDQTCFTTLSWRTQVQLKIQLFNLHSLKFSAEVKMALIVWYFLCVIITKEKPSRMFEWINFINYSFRPWQSYIILTTETQLTQHIKIFLRFSKFFF